MVYGRGSIADVTYNGDDDAAPKIKELLANVVADEDNYEPWEKLIAAVEGFDGGVNRNSSPAAIEVFRDAYDRFLDKFPLFFGYWHKYAELEFAIGGTEAADMVYERGVACVSNSVDLWSNYCIFKTQTSHDPDVMRELFERAAQAVGYDFLAHPFWDKYLEFEERFENKENISHILVRCMHIPMHQSSRYYERMQQWAPTRPVEELVPSDVLEAIKSSYDAELQGLVQPDVEYDRGIRARIHAFHLEIFHKTHVEVQKRWKFESGIKRPYFHVTELEEEELSNWRKYLDFEEAEGDYSRIVFLYDRCLITCAMYDEFWLRYARWMFAQPGKEEEVRNIYTKACSVFVPMSRPTMRLNWARFEEAVGRLDAAYLIYDSIVVTIGPYTEAIVAWGMTIRRNEGINAAIEFFEAQINTPEYDVYVKATLITEQARMLWKAKGDIEEARKLFRAQYQSCLDSRYFCINWLELEMEAPTGSETEAETHERVKIVHDLIRKEGRLSPRVLKDLSHVYMVWLLERIGKEAAKEYMYLDKEVNGPYSVQSQLKSKVAEDGKESTTDRRLWASNGHPGVEVNDVAMRRGEDPYAKYYQDQGEPIASQPLRLV